ncbi:type IX secretion system membrane protein PorP/SprF [Leptobacterium flavescens]|uniref:Type IX secretion system membrane protein PorP/SprF n=1 Tax=Leptobacterium flavescens TaxID=472055 RepID=A0A6P0UIU5_9FLAO|nr:type IX secretion system membrane protein PorP/SprF [Leptobacterium flavescens]NER12907.1 type IX secretion system membrane protein PorP/SprF [Leptobacterium flavescens]
MNCSLTRSFLVLFLLITGYLHAQQDPNYVFYRYNMNVINPAYAGSDGIADITSNLRSQWQGIEGAPRTQTLSAATPFSDRVGLGLSLVNDKTFIERQTAVFIDFSYKLQLDRETSLFMGLKAGGNFFDVNAAGLQTFNRVVDPLLRDESRFNPNLGLGFYLKNEKYFVSLSSPRILNTRRFDERNGVVVEATDELHLFLSGGYDFRLTDDWIFKPSVLMRYVNGAPLSADITAAMGYRELLEFGLAYRTDSAIGGLALFNLTDWLGVGYAYDSSLRSELNEAGTGTHEVLLKFRIRSLTK